MQTFFYLREKTIFFFAINVRQFFYVSSKNFFVVCFPYYVRYHLVFFLVNIFLTNFDNKLFFCPHFSRTFFSDVCGDKLFFFSIPPPPQISNGASLTSVLTGTGHVDPSHIIRSLNVGSMLGDRLRRWRNIESKWDKPFVLAGVLAMCSH